MRIPPIALSIALIIPSMHAASVSLPAGTWSTSYLDPTGQPVMNQVHTDTYDLGDLSGLTPGSPIAVSLTLSGPLVWSGGYGGLGTSMVTLTYNARVEISMGGFIASVVETGVQGAVGPMPAHSLAGVVGAGFLTGPTDLSFVVPWGTDLSSVSVTLTDLSAFTGTGAVFMQSDMNSVDAVLSTTSIPESGSLMLGVLSSMVLLVRRRGKQKRSCSRPN